MPARNQPAAPKETPQIIAATPVAQTNVAAVRRQVRIEQASFSGPLPPPQLLADYGNIDPSLPDRIVKMAEGEQTHRHALETQIVKRSFDEGRRGQHYALIIGVVAVVVGGIAGVMGAPLTGALIGGGGVIGLVTVFILGRNQGEQPDDK